MTVVSTSFQTDWFTADGVQKNWPYNFTIFDKESVVVQIAAFPDDQSTLIEATDDITLVPSDESFDGGYVVYPTVASAIAFGKVVRIVRRVPYTQETEIGNEGDFSPQNHERAFDKATMQIQQINRKVDDIENGALELLGSNAWKSPCAFSTTANVSLSGLGTYDGVTPNPGARALVQFQDNASQNGIYIVNAGAWPRAIDFDEPREVVAGTQVFVNGGTLYGGKAFKTVVPDSVTIGVTEILFEFVDTNQEDFEELIQWNPLKFNGTGDAVSDDLVALRDACNFLADNTPAAPDKQYAYCDLDLGGRTWLISDQLRIRGPVDPLRRFFLRIHNGGIKATSTFAAQANAATSPRPMIVFEDGAYGAIMEHVYVDCMKKSSGIVIIPNSRTTRHVHLRHNTIRRFFNPKLLHEANINTGGEQPPLPATNPVRPYGIRIGTEDKMADNLQSSMCTIENNNISQWDNNDLEGDDWQNFTGIGIDLHAIDTKVRFNAIDSVQKAICIRGWNNEVSFNHPSPPNPSVFNVDHSSERIAGIEVEQYGNNRIIGNYVDNGYIILYGKNQICLGNFFSWNPSSTFGNSTGIVFVATSTNEAFSNDMIFDNNQIMDTLNTLYAYIERAPFNFANKVPNAQVSQDCHITYRQHCVVRLDAVSSALKTATAGGKSLVEAWNKDTTKSVMFGSDGNSWTVELDGTSVMKSSSTVHNMGGLPLQKHGGWVQQNTSVDIDDTFDDVTVVMNGGSAAVFTLKAATGRNVEVRFIKRGAGSLTLTPEAGAKLNGGTGSKTVNANGVCTGRVVWQPGGAAEWLLDTNFT